MKASGQIVFNQLSTTHSVQKKNNSEKKIKTNSRPIKDPDSGVESKEDNEKKEDQQELEREEKQEEHKDKQKFEESLDRSKKILIKVTTIRVLDLFPDDVIVDQNKVSIIYREFFGSERIHSIPIESISDVIVDTSPFASSLKIIDKSLTQNVVEVKNLNTKEAKKIRRIIQGLVIAKSSQIDYSNLDSKGFVKKLEEIGSAR